MDTVKAPEPLKAENFLQLESESVAGRTGDRWEVREGFDALMLVWRWRGWWKGNAGNLKELGETPCWQSARRQWPPPYEHQEWILPAHNRVWQHTLPQSLRMRAQLGWLPDVSLWALGQRSQMTSWAHQHLYVTLQYCEIISLCSFKLLCGNLLEQQ